MYTYGLFTQHYEPEALHLSMMIVSNGTNSRVFTMDNKKRIHQKQRSVEHQDEYDHGSVMFSEQLVKRSN